MNFLLIIISKNRGAHGLAQLVVHLTLDQRVLSLNLTNVL